MHYTKDNLDEFIIEMDALAEDFNNPKAVEFMSKFNYIPSTKINQDLDPFSREYMNSQLRLYRELTGRLPDQTSTELTNFDINAHINSANPYGSRDVTYISKHINSITKALNLANLPSAANILDVGSGWGLSSEVMAYCGASVTGVDINPRFVELNNKRARKLNIDIKAINSSFDDFNTDNKFDAVFFYECLHHSITPWSVIEKYKTFLNDNGALILSGEPVNNFWWKNWGLRLDAMSVYCIRKHGWFESGWSHEFLIKMLHDSNFSVEHHRGVGIGGSDIYVSRLRK